MKTEDLVKEWLKSQGFRYDVDSDGDIHFKYQTHNYFFTVSETDQSFFRLIMPNLYEVEDNREVVLEACNTISRDIKVVKAFLVEDRLWLAIEMFIDTTPELDDFFERCLDILEAARDRIAEEIFG